MRLEHGSWVVVADGEKYLLLENVGSRGKLALAVVRHKAIDNPATHEQGSDRPGRFEDAGIGRSAVDDTDWHRLEKERFAKDLAAELRQATLTHRVAHLLVIAPAKTLGTLRQNLHKETQAALVGDLDKDLTNHTIGDIEAAIEAL